MHHRFPTLIKRKQNNDISKIIMSMERPNISPAVYSWLQHSQPTTASVKRNFTMLLKLFAKDRKFDVENV